MLRKSLAFTVLILCPSALAAQVVTEVKTADTLVVYSIGEVRLLGVDGLTAAASDSREGKCAASTKALIYHLAHAKHVRVVSDDRAIRRRPLLRAFGYVYLPDGRMLNQLVLETGCARMSMPAEDLTFGAMLKSVADQAQVNGHGLYAPAQAEPIPYTPSTYAPQVGNYGVTKAAFDRITLGMRYIEVRSIIGSHGKEVSRSESETGASSRYEWDTDDGNGYIMISFTDERVRSKHQYRLP